MRKSGQILVLWFAVSGVCLAGPQGGEDSNPLRTDADSPLVKAPMPTNPDNPVAISPVLSEASRQMEAASELIAGQETGEKTQELQQQVIERLQLAIDGLQQSGNAQRQPGQEKPTPQPLPENANEDPGQENEAPGNESGPSRKDPGDSTERSGDNEEHQVELANRRVLLQGVWGHLRPALRQQILDLGDERNLPKYDELVKQYFQSLATSSSRDNSD